MSECVVSVGRHKLLVGDITLGAVSELMGDERADVIYSDPPWGQRLLDLFAKTDDAARNPNMLWLNFLLAFASACASHRASTAPVFVEMGLRWVDELDWSMTRVGLTPLQRWAISYGPRSKPSPSTLSLFGSEGMIVEDVVVTLPDVPHGEPVTRAVLAACVKPGCVVLDPCTGRGMTARITHLLGGSFRGTELISSRMARTTSWLRSRL